MFLRQLYLIFSRKLATSSSLRFRVFQLSKLLLSMLAVPSNTVFWRSSTLMYVQFFNPIVRFPTKCSQIPTTIGITSIFLIAHSFYFPFQVVILSHFLNFFLTYCTASRNCDAYYLVLLFLL